MARLNIPILGLLLLVMGCNGDKYPDDVRHKLPPRHHKLLVKYAQIRKQQMEDIAERRGLTIASDYKKFFEAAAAGNWKKADRLYEGFRLKSGQWITKKRFDPDIGNELWQPAHEVGWVYGEFAAWDQDLIDLFARGILNSIPNGSIFFGGTDPGRFVTSAFQVSEGKPDIFIITQNALADMRYAHYIQDLYGEQIWVPSDTNMTEAFQEYVSDITSGKRPQSDQLKIVDGRVQIQGALGLMEINGFLSRMIFENNRDNHEFYLEEAYVIPWMYPYLEPHGFIMKLNPQPVDINEEIVNQDMAFWSNQVHRLTSSTKFLDNRPARRSFSKLRASSAGLYTARGMLPQAEKAFRQALDLYPSSPEANFRLAQEVYLRQGLFKAARQLMQEFKAQKADYDPEHRNSKADEFIQQIDRLEKLSERIAELESEAKTGQMKLESALELAGLYFQMQRKDQLSRMADAIMDRQGLPAPAFLRLANVLAEAKDQDRMVKALNLCLASADNPPPPDALLQMAKLYATVSDYDKMAIVIEKYLEKKPDDWRAWLDLASVYVALKVDDKAKDALSKAVGAGRKEATAVINNDARLRALHSAPIETRSPANNTQTNAFSPDPASFDTVAIVKSPVIMKGIYGTRSQSATNGLSLHGGPGSTEGAVMRCLRWFKKIQAEDGAWSTEQDPKTVATALALLPFLSHGETPASDEFGSSVQKGIKYLVAHQKDDGMFSDTEDASALEHAIATFALCETYGLTRVPELKDHAHKAVGIIIKAQRPSGLWAADYVHENGSDDLEVSVWQIRALRAALMADIQGEELRPILRSAADALKQTIELDLEQKTTAPAVYCLQLLGYGRDPVCKKAMDALQDLRVDWEHPGFDAPVYYWHYTTQANFHFGGKAWSEWNRSFAPALVNSQAIDKQEGEKDCGYWVSPGKKDRYGTIYATSLSCMMLQNYYAYLPAFKAPLDVREPATEDRDVEIKIDL